MSIEDLEPELHPIDFVEGIALKNAWPHDRHDDDLLEVELASNWGIKYNVQFVLTHDETLVRAALHFSLNVPEEHEPALYKLLNLINNELWGSNCGHLKDADLMIFKVGIQLLESDQENQRNIEALISNIFELANTYHPGINLAASGDMSGEEAYAFCIKGACGKA